MVIIRSILGCDFYLRATIAPVFGVVIIGDDFDFFNRVFVWSDDRSAAPRNAGYADAIDLVVVFTGASTVGNYLSTILDIKNASRVARATDGGSRKIFCSAARVPRPIPKRTGSQIQELKHITPKGGEFLDIVGRHCTADVRSSSVNQWSSVSDIDSLGSLSDISATFSAFA